MKNKTSLSLMELLLMVLVFLLAAALCVKVFVYSRLRSADDELSAMAERKAQYAAEMIKAADGDLARAAKMIDVDNLKCAAYYPEALEMYFDENWEPHSAFSAIHFTYRLVAEKKTEGYLGTADIVVTDVEGKELYRLSASWQEADK